MDLGGAQSTVSISPELRTQVEEDIGESFVDAFRLMMGLCGILALISAVVAFATITNQITHHDESVTSPFEIMG